MQIKEAMFMTYEELLNVSEEKNYTYYDYR